MVFRHSEGAWIQACGAGLAAILLLSGCASTNDEEILARLMRETRVPAEAAPVIAGDVPDEPALDLPPDLVVGEGGFGGMALTIQPDCLLQIKVREDPGLDGSYPVNEIGAVALGYVGPVILYNKTEREAELKIRDILKTRGAFKNATVSVKIIRASYDKIQVAGAVHRPGLIRIGQGDTISLNDALLRAGGIIPSPAGSKVRMVRGGLLSAVVLAIEGEVLSLMTEDGKPMVPDVFLKNNDFIYVFSSSQKATTGAVGAKEILVLGEVKRPGVYRFSGGEPCTIMHLMLKMGPLQPYADAEAVEIIRRDEGGYETTQKVDVTEILKDGNPDKDIPLENGDRIIVRERRWHWF